MNSMKHHACSPSMGRRVHPWQGGQRPHVSHPCQAARRALTAQPQPREHTSVVVPAVQPLLLSLCAAALVWQASSPASALAMERDIDTFENVPEQLRSDGGDVRPRLGSFLEGGKRKEIETCTKKCVPTCIRGGDGSPGLGPISMRRDVVVFKEGFRSRSYCLRECVEVCSLSINAPPPGQAAK